MRVHPGAVVGEERLRHEGDGLAGLPRDVLADVLVPLQRVGDLHQRVEPEVDLGLAGGGHLVVLRLDLQPHLLHDADHLVAQVVLRVGRRDGEVPFLVARLVAEVRLLLSPGVPGPLVGVDGIEAEVRPAAVADVVEDEELGLRSEVRRVRDAGRLQVRLGLPRDVAGVAGVVLLGDRVDDVADQRKRRPGDERIDDRRLGVGDHQHVGGVDRLPAADGRPVEAEPFLEAVLLELIDRHREVLPGADEIHELQVDHLDVLALGETEDFLRVHCDPSLGRMLE